MATMLSYLFVLAFGCFVGVSHAAPEQGIWSFNIDKIDKTEVIKSVYKSLFNNSQISLSVICHNNNLVPLTIRWMVRYSPCANEYLVMPEAQLMGYMASATKGHVIAVDKSEEGKVPYKMTTYVQGEIHLNCSKAHHELIHPFNGPPQVVVYETPAEDNPQEENKKKEPSNKKNEAKEGSESSEGSKLPEPEDKGKRTKREVAKEKKDKENSGKDAGEGGGRTKEKDETAPTENKVTTKEASEVVMKKPAADDQSGRFVQVWEDGYYLFLLFFSVRDQQKATEDVNIQVTIQMRYGNSFLSAVEWPLLIFYGVMGLVYIFFGIFWLVMLACNWRDLLRVQFWIGGVIFLGMLEKAVFFGEYESISNTGQSVQGAVIVAELVSCLKRTLARMLVIIVSLGYGIVKPRLGQSFHKILFVGVVFFILASFESCSRALSGRADQSMKLLVASIPLAVTDAIICWWIFSSLLQTTRTLRLRRNVVKLSLYRHFTNTLIFSVIASVAYMIWFMTQHRLKACITDWKELWIDDAFWPLLFSVILFVIMVLWRPSANNQRYAFSPLLDAADDDLDDEQTLSEAYEGMKMRTTNVQQKNGSPRVKEDYKEDDLKWVEDNIPSSLADRVLPALDSDEEIMNTKFEMSKME